MRPSPALQTPVMDGYEPQYSDLRRIRRREKPFLVLKGYAMHGTSFLELSNTGKEKWIHLFLCMLLNYVELCMLRILH